MKYIKKVVFLFLMLCTVLLLKPTNVYAAAGTISFSDPSAMLGSEVTVKVKVSTTDDTMLGGVDLTLSYDDSALEFVSGTSASGSAGTIRIAGVIDNASTTSLSYSLTFKTLKAGTSGISVSSYEIISLDYEPISISKIGSSSVAINEKEEVKASSDCKLASLNISPGTLSPEFSPTTVEYSATVAYETSKLAVSATPNHSKASVTKVTGTDLNVGSNTVRVIVTAESGASVAYVINVTRESEPKQEEPTKEETETQEEPDTSEQEVIEVTMEDVVYHILSDIPDEMIPDGFEKNDYTYKNEEIKVLKSNIGDLILFYLEGENGGRLFIYEEEKETFLNYIPMAFQVSLIVLEPDDTVLIPEGFTKGSFLFNETTITAYQSDQNQDFYLVYGRNSVGNREFYLYDSVEGSLQRYVGSIVISEENAEEVNTTTKELDDQLNKQSESFGAKLQNRMYILYIVSAICVILLFIIINLILKLKDIKEDRLIEEEESQDFENYIGHREDKEKNTNITQEQKKSKKSKPKKIKEKEFTEDSNQVDASEFEITFIDLNEEENENSDTKK